MNIVQKSENFIFELFKSKATEAHLYHNFQHVFRVTQACIEIGKNEEISEEEIEILTLAALFHDAGYCDSCENHEKKSAQIAREFLLKNRFPEEKIQTIERLIITTEAKEDPSDLLEAIIRDADTSHFADENYLGIADLLKEELERTQNKFFTSLEWAEINRNLLLNQHRYFTNYAKTHWQSTKEANINALQKRIQKLKYPEEAIKIKKKDPEQKEDKFSRAIDTMFRVTLNNHTRLSEIADSKANILLSVNAIIISIILGTLIPKLDAEKNVHLIMPTFVLMLSSVTTIIFAILSTRPKVTEGSFTREQIEQRKVNLLFFGNFHKMPLEEYDWAMDDLMKDREALYSALTRDLYYLGLVLNRKYRLLRITYGIFMLGIILSVIAFVYAFVAYDIMAV